MSSPRLTSCPPSKSQGLPSGATQRGNAPGGTLTKVLPPKTAQCIRETAAVCNSVQRGEKGAHRIDLDLVVAEQVKAFERVVLGKGICNIDGRGAQERVLQIGTWRPQLGDIHCIDIG